MKSREVGRVKEVSVVSGQSSVACDRAACPPKIETWGGAHENDGRLTIKRERASNRQTLLFGNACWLLARSLRRSPPSYLLKRTAGAKVSKKMMGRVSCQVRFQAARVR